jgi:hypothetical protein
MCNGAWCIVYSVMVHGAWCLVQWCNGAWCMVQWCNGAWCMSSKPAHDEVYSIQHYLNIFARDLPVRWFSQGTAISSTNRPDGNDVTEILL